MKTISLCFLLFSNVCFAQTKEETEEWIRYQLENKFMYAMGDVGFTQIVPNQDLCFYRILGNQFCIIKAKTIEFKPYWQSFTAIDLSKLKSIDITIETEKNIDNLMASYITFTYNTGYHGIKNGTTNNEESFNNDLALVKPNGTGFCIVSYINYNPQIKELVSKIKKAILHLAKLNGAKLIDADLF